MVGSGDVHRLWQMGTTYSLVDVEGNPTADSICAAIKTHRVAVHADPISIFKAGLTMASIFAAELRPR